MFNFRQDLPGQLRRPNVVSLADCSQCQPSSHSQPVPGADIGWHWLALAGTGWHWLALAGTGWHWLARVGTGWHWLALAGTGSSFP